MRTQRWFAEKLARQGFSDHTIEAKAKALALCDTALDLISASRSSRISVWAPGRIEVFGKHTDYAGGRSLLTAVERGFHVRASPRQDSRIRIIDPTTGNAFETLLGCEAEAPDGHWSNYVATAVRRIARNFPDARTGVDLAFVSDLPVAAGVSSSSALMIGIFLALASVNRLAGTPQWQQSLSSRPELGGYLGAMENGLSFGNLEGDLGVGTLGGSQDQTAIFCAEPDQIVDFGWMPVRRNGSYALPDTHCFVVASSGVVAEKSAGARELYNRASLLVTELVSLWNTTTGRRDASLAAAVESDSGAPDALRGMIQSNAGERFSAESLRMRLDQFLLETYTLIPAAANAFAMQDWSALGTVTARSQQAAESWLGNQVPETMALVRFARERGAIAASAFGAGFGGSVWALVERAQAAAFTEQWSDAYRRAFFAQGVRETFFSTDAGPAAMQWSDDDAVTH